MKKKASNISESLVIKKGLGETKVVGLRLSLPLLKKLNDRNIDIQKSCRNFLTKLVE